MPKCQWCKESGDKEQMKCDEKPTGKFNNNGTPKMFRKYYHEDCYTLHLKDQEFKKIESEKLDKLYLYILNLHDLLALDGRMMEKIQDLRNGTVKVNNKKITKYKAGVPYDVMLQTYKYLNSTIDNILRTMEFKEKWNEFSYVFGTMVRSLNDIMQMNKQVESHKNKVSIINKEEIEIVLPSKKKKANDDLDITEFL